MTVPGGATRGPPTDLVVERDGPIVIWRLNRPERLNAVTRDMYDALRLAAGRAASDRAIRAAVLTGEGRGFCVGADLKAHGDRDTTEAPDDYIRSGQEANRALQAFPKPLVAAINGHAVGAGLELALSCDFLIAARDAKLRLPELSLGTFVGGGTVYTLAARVGAARAREILLLGEFVLGADAPQLGLVTTSVENERVLPTALALAHELAQRAPISVARAKDLLRRAGELTRDEAMALEADALRRCMATSDWREGVDAFHQKRPPRFTGD
ncbi:MAG TPA: enoyl-CoA hydratase/isomerase family protein [Gemmatimonadales bacterium]